jgi:preprotein translocase subunit SecF
MTYSDTVNLSMNQVLARSLNTSLVAILPILSILVIGSWILGATALNDFGLALFVGLTTGAYSSIFIASPLLALLKEREPRYSEIRRRLGQAAPGGRRITPKAAATGNLSGVSALPSDGPATSVAVMEQPYGSDVDPDSDLDAEEPTESTSIPLRTTAIPARTGTRPPPRPRKKGRRR